MDITRRAGRQALIALAVVIAAASVLGLVVVALGPVAWFLGGRSLERLTGKARLDGINTTRGTVISAYAWLASLAAFGLSIRNYFLTRRQQVTTRFSTAVGLLASERQAERLGGVYALEHVMRESSRDHDTVVEILAAVVRAKEDTSEGLQPEVEAAMTVLARRPIRTEANKIDLRGSRLAGLRLRPGARLSGVDLTGADLAGAQLRGAVLRNAVLDEAKLSGVMLKDADLGGASLERVDLTGARLDGVNLKGACLLAARMREATLRSADLAGAQLDEAELPVAVLSSTIINKVTLVGTDLSLSLHLTEEQLLRAYPVSTTILAEVHRTEQVRARIRTCDMQQHRPLPPAR